MLTEATKFCKQKCYFLTFFCPADDPVHINWRYYVQKAPEQYPANIELVIDNLTNNSQF